MKGCREVIKVRDISFNIVHQVEAIEAFIEFSPSHVFDLSKSIIDTVCKTIHRELGKKVNKSSSDTQNLFRNTIKFLNLHGENVDNTKYTEGELQKIINGLITSVQGICSIRNKYGMSHGKDAEEPSLEKVHAEFVASAADNIVLFLYQCHRKYNDITSLYYKENEQINTIIDENYLENPSKFFSLYPPSKILHALDQDSYIEHLSNIKSDIKRESNDD